MSFLNTKLAKNMTSYLLRINKITKNMTFLNMQLAKKYDFTITFMTS